MDIAAISTIIGYSCHLLNDEGTIALIDIPFTFADGDDVPAYVEVGPGFVRFFDDGEVFDHFFFRGLFRDDEGDTEVLSAIAAASGVSFTEALQVEIDAAPADAAGAFANYLAAMLAFVGWEKAWEAKMGDEVAVAALK